MSVHPGSQPSFLLPMLALAILVAPVGLLHAGPNPGPASAPPAFSTCSGAALDSLYAGALVVEGGPLLASAVSNVSLVDAFESDATWTNLSTNAVVARQCEPIEERSETSATGSFSLPLVLPNSSCDRFARLCVAYAGLFGPISVGPVSGVPAGYLTSDATNGSSLTVAYVAELQTIELDPAGSIAEYSPGASESISVQALTGNGSVSPRVPEFTWQLNGTGWNFERPPSGSTVTIIATPGAAPGSISVMANLTAGTTLLTAGPDRLLLDAIPTSISSTRENRTSVDEGRPVLLSVTALGAPGYSYNVSVLPGLGVPAQPFDCDSELSSDAATSLECSATIAYPTTGTATPQVVVSNGYSSANAFLSPITILPPPSIEVAPSTLAGYVGDPVDVQVEALPGTGSGPYVEACFAPGAGATVCASTAGPVWTFRPIYPSTGNFNASAWALDGDGVVGATAVPVTIAAPLSLSPPFAGSTTIPVGSLLNLTANLSGGFLPGAFWWNVSGSNSSLARGSVTRDGALPAAWVPSVVGPTYLTLTVVDGLGTEVQSTLLVTVVPDQAVSLPAVELPPAGAVAAGTPISLAWQAYNAHGVAAGTFAPRAGLRLTTPLGAAVTGAWVNVSGIGPLAPNGTGGFDIPASAWALGRLSLTVTTIVAGPIEIALTGPEIPGSSPDLSVDIAPDLQHLELYDPDVVVAGDRTNRTFWFVRDVYGNPAVGASLEVDLETEGTALALTAPVLETPSGAVGIWVNFSMPSAAGGSLEVRSTEGAGATLLGPIAIPSAPSGSIGTAPWIAVAGLAPFGALAIGGAIWARRRPARRTTDESETVLSEASLGDFVRGRDRVIETVRAAGAVDLAGIERGWGSIPPPDGIVDWVASLVADGTLGARTGPDGIARFCLRAPASGPAHVILDVGALDRGMQARDELTREDDP